MNRKDCIENTEDDYEILMDDYDDLVIYTESLDIEIARVEQKNAILHQALKAIATPQEYKLIMQEVENVNQQTKGE